MGVIRVGANYVAHWLFLIVLDNNGGLWNRKALATQTMFVFSWDLFTTTKKQTYSILLLFTGQKKVATVLCKFRSSHLICDFSLRKVCHNHKSAVKLYSVSILLYYNYNSSESFFCKSIRSWTPELCLSVLSSLPSSFVFWSNPSVLPSAAAPVPWSGHTIVTASTTQEHTPSPSIRPIRLLLHSPGCVSVGTGWLKACVQETIPALSPDAQCWCHLSSPAGPGGLWEGEGLQERDRQWVGRSSGHLGDVARLGVAHFQLHTYSSARQPVS